VESVGLHGEGFAVGYVVIDTATGAIVEDGLFQCDPRLASGLAEDFTWITENVVPALAGTKTEPGRTLVLNESSPVPVSVRRQFWERWWVWSMKGAWLAADVAWPVEARFLCACIDENMPGRKWSGPYPLVDIASVRMAVGLDPLGIEERNESETPAHCPLADARQSARLLMEALQPGGAECQS
jgi:hypothetical protein